MEEVERRGGRKERGKKGRSRKERSRKGRSRKGRRASLTSRFSQVASSSSRFMTSKLFISLHASTSAVRAATCSRSRFSCAPSRVSSNITPVVTVVLQGAASGFARGRSITKCWPTPPPSFTPSRPLVATHVACCRNRTWRMS